MSDSFNREVHVYRDKGFTLEEIGAMERSLGKRIFDTTDNDECGNPRGVEWMTSSDEEALHLANRLLEMGKDSSPQLFDWEIEEFIDPFSWNHDTKRWEIKE